MRVELLYAPGCSSYNQARNQLEMVIAEERLPCPVELIEEDNQVDGSPQIRINGDHDMHSATSHSEGIRELLCRKWREITEAPLLRIS